MGFGFGCVSGAYLVHNNTYIDLSNPATIGGNIEKVCVYSAPFGVSVNAKIKIFRDDGTNYQIIVDRSIVLKSGLHTYNITSATVQVGDLIGIYTPYISAANESLRLDNGGSAKYKSGDITTDTAKNTWSDSFATPCIQGFFSYYVKTSGNDSLDAMSWSNAWATINKAATTVPDGSIIHIEHGTYNAEPAGNKIAPQNTGVSKIEYQVHTAGGGTGIATVTVEKN